MNSFRDVIAAWPTLEDFVADAGTTANTAKQWRTRDKIPDEHWRRVADGASKRRIKGVTLEFLAALAEAKRAA